MMAVERVGAVVVVIMTTKMGVTVDNDGDSKYASKQKTKKTAVKTRRQLWTCVLRRDASASLPNSSHL